jgi:hypothetical protein
LAELTAVVKALTMVGGSGDSKVGRLVAAMAESRAGLMVVLKGDSWAVTTAALRAAAKEQQMADARAEQKVCCWVDQTDERSAVRKVGKWAARLDASSVAWMASLKAEMTADCSVWKTAVRSASLMAGSRV